MVTSRPRFLLALVGATLLPWALAAQAAVDPSVAPRAAAMARQGARSEATELLGEYLATAPDDAAAWMELGYFYLLDSRTWHVGGHRGEPTGPLFLDLAATALDESLRLPTDSSRYLRALVEVDRLTLLVEAGGWVRSAGSYTSTSENLPPSHLLEAGANLVNSCPVGGVMVIGSDLEAAGIWGVLTVSNQRRDLLLLIPALYRSDSIYRFQMAAALEVDANAPVAEALARTSSRRPVCLTPGADSSVTPAVTLRPVRLVRVAGPVTDENGGALSIIELTTAWRTQPSGIAREVTNLYVQAARYNQQLCTSLLLPLGARDRAACGR
jgi:hypothetical protein